MPVAAVMAAGTWQYAMVEMPLAALCSIPEEMHGANKATHAFSSPSSGKSEYTSFALSTHSACNHSTSGMDPNLVWCIATNASATPGPHALSNGPSRGPVAVFDTSPNRMLRALCSLLTRPATPVAWRYSQ